MTGDPGPDGQPAPTSDLPPDPAVVPPASDSAPGFAAVSSPAAAGATPPARPRNRTRWGLVVGGATALGALAVKVLIGFLAVSVAGQALGALFGGPYDRLPSDVRSGFELRLDSALGSQLNGLSDADRTARVQALIDDGLPRLDDATLVARFGLLGQAIDQTDVATCAAFARADFGGTQASDEVSTKLVSGLDDPSLQRWVEINIEAIEAAARGAPPAHVITADDANAQLTTLVDGLSAADQATSSSLTSGGTVTDADACAVERSLDQGTLALAPADLAVMARLVVSP